MHLQHWNKVHVMGVLSAALGLTRYLEITTTMTGGRYAEAYELSFATCMRIVYRTKVYPARDYLPVDFASETDDITDAVAEIRRQNLRFDLILVDGHHTYECASRDLRVALSLVSPGGVILVHDVDPPNRHVASPLPHDGEWCGVTYRSFIDFCLANGTIDYVALDADYGCGIILTPRNPIRMAKNLVRARRQAGLASKWAVATTDADAAFTLFEAKKAALLRLVDFDGLRRKLAGAR